MLQKLETPLEPLRAKPPESPPAAMQEDAADHDDGLLAAAVPIMIAAYGAAFAFAVFTFLGSRETLLAIAICVVYIGMFFGTPLLMTKVRNARDERWRGDAPERSSEKVKVFGGALGRTEAVLQMVIAPVGVALAFAAFGIIWTAVRP